MASETRRTIIPFLERSECAATVANAVPSIRAIASIVATRENGAGLAELIDNLIATDFCHLQDKIQKHLVPIGRRADGTTVTVSPYGQNILIAGPSGTGKSTVTAGIVERLMKQQYQVCIVDPEGDYGTLPDVITLGNQNHAITVNEVLAFIEDPKVTLNVNLLGIPLADRPAFFGQLFPSLQAMRTRTGRPHWIILDEAHHMLPPEWSHLDTALSQSVGEMVLVTVHPDHLAPMALSLVDVAIAVGPSPEETIKKFAEAISQPLVWPDGLGYQKGKAVAWFPRRGDAPFSMQILPGALSEFAISASMPKATCAITAFSFGGRVTDKISKPRTSPFSLKLPKASTRRLGCSIYGEVITRAGSEKP